MRQEPTLPAGGLRARRGVEPDGVSRGTGGSRARKGRDNPGEFGRSGATCPCARLAGPVIDLLDGRDIGRCALLESICAALERATRRRRTGVCSPQYSNSRFGGWSCPCWLARTSKARPRAPRACLAMAPTAPANLRPGNSRQRREAVPRVYFGRDRQKGAWFEPRSHSRVGFMRPGRLGRAKLPSLRRPGCQSSSDRSCQASLLIGPQHGAGQDRTLTFPIHAHVPETYAPPDLVEPSKRFTDLDGSCHCPDGTSLSERRDHGHRGRISPDAS
jgi:hypothetical protein